MKQAQNKDQEKQNWPIMRNPTRFPHFMGWLATFVLVTYIIYTLKLLSSPPSLSCYEDISLSLSLLPDNVTKQSEEERVLARKNVTLDDVVFGVAGSANLWERRKDYIKLWWRKPEMRGVVWLDREVRTRPGENLPEVKVSGNVDKFRYTNRQGQKLAIRITRVVSETYRLGLKNVKWFVMGDDDTFFVTDNLLRVLSKYDHNEFYYIGSSSESHLQNIYFSYSMAFGGGGFAISYPLAKELEKMQDRCIQRYPGLFASDDRVQACMAELGVPLTKEVGFHQYDVIGNLFGLLAAHPVAPLVTMHHLDVVEPIFPNKTRLESLQKLTVPMKLDSASLIQQSICYDHKNKWTVSISWGYAIQIFRGILSPREIEMPSRTFLNWYKRADYTSYSFNTRPVSRNSCQKPFVFYLSRARMVRNETLSEYIHHRVHHPSCRWKMASPDHLERVEVFKKPDPHLWDRHDDLREFYSVSEAKTYFLDLPELRGKMCMETKGWIVTASDKGEMALVHPLTHVEIQLPHQNTSKCYNKHPMEPLIFVQRAVLSSPPNPKNENDCVLMIVHGGVGDIGICRPGRDNVWTVVDKNIVKCAINSLEYRDKFYVLSNLGEMWEYDVIGKSKDTVPVSPRKLKLNILKHLCCNQSYLVASEGSLLVVFRNGIECMDYGSTKFWVFEIDIDHEGYKEVTSLGSRAIFVGHSASLSIDTICHPELIPNSIYFTDDCFETYLSRPEGGGMNMGIYSLEDKSVRSHYSGKSLSRVCPPVWTFLTIK